MCCRKRIRAWSDESSIGSSDSENDDSVNAVERLREDDRSRGSNGSEGGISESGEVDRVALEEEQGDDDGEGSESEQGGNDGEGSESEWESSGSDDHYGSDELVEIHDYVDAEYNA